MMASGAEAVGAAAAVAPVAVPAASVAVPAAPAAVLVAAAVMMLKPSTDEKRWITALHAIILKRQRATTSHTPEAIANKF